jgi:hypothetical protein
MADGHAQQVLAKTLHTLKKEQVRLAAQIRAIEGALTAMGVRSPHLAARRKRKRMTVAERREVSRRMKAYWAKRRTTRKSA